MKMKTRETSEETKKMERRHHTHQVLRNQCSSRVVQVIEAPLQLVWGLVREFSNPQAYKQFIKSCKMVNGNGEDEGSVREVKVMSGLPAEWSMERLERLDDELHVIAFTIIGGDHRLSNYQSTTTVHEEEILVAAAAADHVMMHTVVIESYVVDVPTDNSSEEASCFAETIIGCNLRSLATVSLLMHRQ